MFVKLTRILPDGNVPIAVNADLVVWVAQVNGKVTLFTESGPEVEVAESFGTVLGLLGME